MNDYKVDKFFNMICSLARLGLQHAPSYIEEKMALLDEPSIYVWQSLDIKNQEKVKQYYSRWKVEFPQDTITREEADR